MVFRDTIVAYLVKGFFFEMCSPKIAHLKFVLSLRDETSVAMILVCYLINPKINLISELYMITMRNPNRLWRQLNNYFSLFIILKFIRISRYYWFSFSNHNTLMAVNIEQLIRSPSHYDRKYLET